GIVEIQVPASWKDAKDEDLTVTATCGGADVLKYVNSVQAKINAQDGNSLPVSAFVDYADGSTPTGSAAYEKRGIAVDVPVWNPESCLQCNLCSYVCPHAVIRPVVMDADAAAKAPAGTAMADMKGVADKKFVMSISVLDCTGCGSCVNVCPEVKGNKALAMANLETQLEAQKMFDYGVTLETPDEVLEKFKVTTPKGSQFKQPLLEFSGACAGCGETPYAKLITQLFGDRMYISNATGCSSIWGGSSPSCPYTVNKEGKGPAWANSLFEDNAEYGFGMQLAQKALRNRVVAAAKNLLAVAEKDDVKAALQGYIDTVDSSTENGPATKKMIAALEACGCDNEDRKYILANKDFAAKKSQWIFGGDGWAYDIGFGGVDHVLAANQDVNIFVFDTEVYSNTGGQSSKATPTGAIAQFAAAGKDVKKKDLAAIAMSYGYVYVAQIAQGADYNQCVKAIAEAEAYPGPSLIIAYAPCINHGIKGGMKNAQTEEKNAVAAGYWHLFRFDPRLAEEGKNPFQLDSKAPTADYKAFIESEVRYNRLSRTNPERANALFEKAAKDAADKYAKLAKMAE
ncbi:MAG: 4Fe-4S binding protein, partial [Bacteroidales bacterium]|nr:4Fe-4S binding protein [Bacteroidales bacterium]